MKFTLTNLLLLAPLTATALPTSLLTPRTCPRVYPVGTTQVELLNYPAQSILTTQTLTFTLPSPASSLQGPCTLRATFPPHWDVLDSQLQASSANEPLAVNVYAIDGPAPGALVGTSRFGGSSQEARTVWINSFACRDTMAFRFELAGVGEVAFANGPDGAGGEGGVEMTWGC